MSTVRPAAISDWAATWPPKTRWRSSLGLTPRKMLTSMGSRSRRSTRKSSASLTAPSCQVTVGIGAPAAMVPRHPTRRCVERPASAACLGPATVAARGAIGFPDRFLWGTATAAHQIEGGNVNNDWWEFEHDPTVGLRRGERRRLRLVQPLPRGHRAGGRPRVLVLPVLARVEPDRAGGGGVLPGGPRPLPADGRHLPSSRTSCRWSPSTISPIPVGWPRPEPGRRARAPDRFARFCERVHRAPRGPDRDGRHPQRAQRGGHHGVAARDLPARVRDRTRRGRGQRGAGGRPPQGGRGHPLGPGGLSRSA